MSQHYDRKNELYTCILHSKDRINSTATVNIASRGLPPNADDFDRSGEPDAKAPVNHNPRNLSPDILDTRTCIFDVDWKSILPAHCKKFKLTAYFCSDLCIQPDVNAPDILFKVDADPDNDFDFSRAIGNTSDGRQYSFVEGSLLKIMAHGLHASNVFDTHTKGRSSCICMVKRIHEADRGTAANINNYFYESLSPQMISPMVDYPTQNLLRVQICGLNNEPMYPESFLLGDYFTNNTGDPYENVLEEVPVMADWSLVLTFEPLS